MPKKRERSGEEFWKAQVRELQKENKSLKQRLKQLEKREHLVDDLIQDTELSRDSEDTYRELPKAVRCEDCGKGVLVEYEIMNKCFGTCNICGFRKRLR